MKTFKQLLVYFFALALLSCATKDEKEEDPTPQNGTSNGIKIESVSPLKAAFDTEITIKGGNFSEITTENTVTFNDKKAIVVSAARKELVVKVPKGAGSGPIKVVVGSKDASWDSFTYELTNTISTVNYFDHFFFTSLYFDANNAMHVTQLSPGMLKVITGRSQATELSKGRLYTVPIFTNGSLSDAVFMFLTASTFDQSGNLFLADHSLIYKVTPQKQVSLFAGSYISNSEIRQISGYKDGPANQAQFNAITDLDVDNNGNLIVIEANRIRKITPQGMVSTFAGTGVKGYRDGAGNQAQFAGLYKMDFDKNWNLFVTDSENNCIRMVTPQGQVSTVAGTRQAGYKDGAALQAQFFGPSALIFDKDWNLFVGEAGNYRIRKIDTQGQVSTLAGDGTNPLVYKDGKALEATVDTPIDFAFDKNGNLYFISINDRYPSDLSRICKVISE
ncbi:IPT/TIG domain-containing protein [Rufibacter ruber]|uniref:IPT/TIG domain-containing protein n=1 Tax=Rufibacter ruber TaxID=1783499 RepID=UPI000832A90E|nr:IPT/TIG domain-containing protein [Rufibacter ruber]